jgi:hypothetical protein
MTRERLEELASIKSHYSFRSNAYLIQTCSDCSSSAIQLLLIWPSLPLGAIVTWTTWLDFREGGSCTCNMSCFFCSNIFWFLFILDYLGQSSIDLPGNPCLRHIQSTSLSTSPSLARFLLIGPVTVWAKFFNSSVVEFYPFPYDGCKL